MEQTTDRSGLETAKAQDNQTPPAETGASSDQVLQLQKQIEQLQQQLKSAEAAKETEKAASPAPADDAKTDAPEAASEKPLAAPADEPASCEPAAPAAEEKAEEATVLADKAKDKDDGEESAKKESTLFTGSPAVDKAPEQDLKKATKSLFSKFKNKGSKNAGQDAEEGAEEKKPEPEETPRVHHGLFRALAKAAPLVLLFILMLVSWTPLLTTDFLCPEEVKNVQVILAQHGMSLLPHAEGNVLLPVYGWAAAALAALPLPFVKTLPLISFAGAAVCLIGLCCLARTFRLGSDTMLASGIILLCLPLFLGMANCVGPIPFACGLSMIAMSLLCRAWMKEFDIAGMVAGYIFAVLALLSGGLYFGLVPVVSGLIFALWRGNLARMRAADALAGFICFIALPLLWLGILILFGKDVPTEALLEAMFSAPSGAVFSGRISKACLAFMPFLLVLLTISWPTLFKNLIKNIRASRSENASAYLWIAIVLGIVLALLAARTFDIFLVVCLAALLAGRALLNLSVNATRAFFILTGLALLAATLGLLALVVPFVNELVVGLCPHFASLVPQDFIHEVNRESLLITVPLALLPFLAALIIAHVAWRSRTAAAPLLTCLACVLVLAQPVGLFVMPYKVSQMTTLKMTDAQELAAAAGLDAKPDADSSAAEQPAQPAEKPQEQPQKFVPSGAAADPGTGSGSSSSDSQIVRPTLQAPDIILSPEEEKPAETKAPAEGSKPEAKPDEAKAAPETPAEGSKPEAMPEEAKAATEAPAEESKPESAAPQEAKPAEELPADQAKPAEIPADKPADGTAKPEEKPAAQEPAAGTL